MPDAASGKHVIIGKTAGTAVLRSLPRSRRQTSPPVFRAVATVSPTHWRIYRPRRGDRMTPGGSGRWFCRLLTYLGLVLGARGPRAAASPWGTYQNRLVSLRAERHTYFVSTRLGSSAASCRTIGHHNCSSLRMNWPALITALASLRCWQSLREDRANGSGPHLAQSRREPPLSEPQRKRLPLAAVA